ncbi:aspartate--tRNA ligase [Salisediminibacterium halotolerans]|uniref:Aspartate--tRNA ligase n=1 Tax=Salisediminibacterium halotolerans TaxID=517425 RepID=A0A1H9VBI3_9BACI|nr:MULTISPECIES: aspartate--tRNA ligase [Salisediminibacterium]RLJ78376.1 aspartyl-tRNA synthetase [Actinophytocola xinjiangensis]RPE88282.1 aspartyl-tRNA synthetase [Salisediminibacterium halotolerans]TWG37352.1 aspartyl-tRNA synthetase [Salisediminibacterium halotolerans]SES18891.1 aspartyl-tRNA synthetase [Salisediminibacterium haloalkalitolerans]GEL06817.1 aspartate--tRNA(Asp/Asn) ligase [Salisediminibacterium halotolerans]
MTDRTHVCGELNEAHIDEEVRLQGWVRRRRDLGELIFLDIRDRSGYVQTVFNAEISREAHRAAEDVRNEFVVEVRGVVRKRDEENVNEKIATGKIEVVAEELTILNKAKALPFQIEDDVEITEDVRLKHRYLDLRRPYMTDTMYLRHRTTKLIRDILDEQRFMEVETPILTKSTPEGARDYLVPSRVHEGSFYALPQSPQLFKQLLMVSGFERYYQIARCFRDEDLRADRQPEFTQVDIEASFMGKEDLLAMMEEMMARIVKEVKGAEIERPFPRLTYYEAMERFGSDKPDLRFGMELVDVSEIVKDSGFKVFASTVERGDVVKGINIKGVAGRYSRKDLDDLSSFAEIYGAKGLAWVKVEDGGTLKGPIAKFFDEAKAAELVKAFDAEADDVLMFVADKQRVAWDVLGNLRNKFAKELDLIDSGEFNFLWITEFPLLSYDEDSGRYVAEHHPFTRPVEEDIPKLTEAPEEVRAEAYDLVFNGYELGGGSQRIFERDLQENMFRALGFSDEEAVSQFGFLLDAFEYGTPPHGGIALGLDRLVMILAERTNLRDTIAFPKTASASDLMTNAPDTVSDEQLQELKLKVTAKKE